MIHEQLEVYIECLKNGNLDEFSQKFKRGIDPRTKAILGEITARGGIIFDCEYIVGDPDTGLGTAVDVVFFTNANAPQIWCIEIKTGYDSGYEGPTKRRIKKPFNMLDDSPYSQHQLQLLLTKHLFEKMTNVAVHGAEVWRIGTPQGPLERCPINIYPLHPGLSDLGQTLLDCVYFQTLATKRR